MKTNKTKTNKTAKTEKNGPGRPKYTPVIPRGKFTFAEFCTENGVGKDGKGAKCSALTLRKFLARDAKLGKKSQVLLTDDLANPDNKQGLGRKAFLYQRRSVTAVHKSVTNATRKAAVKVSTPATADYEAQKAALGIGEPAVNTTPEPAPVAETVTEVPEVPATV
jgi:hypothetical protein